MSVGKHPIESIAGPRIVIGQRVGDDVRLKRKPFTSIAPPGSASALVPLSRVVVGHGISVGDKGSGTLVLNPDALSRKRDEGVRRRTRVAELLMAGRAPPSPDAEER